MDNFNIDLNFYIVEILLGLILPYLLPDSLLRAKMRRRPPVGVQQLRAR